MTYGYPPPPEWRPPVPDEPDTGRPRGSSARRGAPQAPRRRSMCPRPVACTPSRPHRRRRGPAVLTAAVREPYSPQPYSAQPDLAAVAVPRLAAGVPTAIGPAVRRAHHQPALPAGPRGAAAPARSTPPGRRRRHRRACAGRRRTTRRPSPRPTPTSRRRCRPRRRPGCRRRPLGTGAHPDRSRCGPGRATRCPGGRATSCRRPGLAASRRPAARSGRALPATRRPRGVSFREVPGLLRQLPHHKPWMVAIGAIASPSCCRSAASAPTCWSRTTVRSSGPRRRPQSTVLKRDISNRDADPNPLTADDAFPTADIVVDPNIPPYKRIGDAQAAEDCRVGANGDVGTLLKDNGCSQVVRATFLTPDGGHYVTAGIFNLPDTAAAQGVPAPSARPRARSWATPPARTPTRWCWCARPPSPILRCGATSCSTSSTSGPTGHRSRRTTRTRR